MMRLGQLVSAAVLTCPGVASAHSFGRLYNLPVPLWLYLYGAAAALLASFALLAGFARMPVAPQPARHLRTFTLPRGLARSGLILLKAASVSLLLLCIVTGLLGARSLYLNFNMTCFWIMFVLVFTYLTALAGDLFRFISPWRVLSDLLPERWRQGRFIYPASWSYWPAFLLYLGFILVELFGKTTPLSLAVLLAAYTAFNLVGVWLFGQQIWFRHVEFFGVFLRLVALMAPVSWQQGRMQLRIPFSGLLGLRAESNSLVLFILFMLASTAFDGLHSTAAWVALFWADPLGVMTVWLGKAPIYFYQSVRPWYTLFDVSGLCLAPLFYFAVFWIFTALAKVITASPLAIGFLLQRMVFSLLPIALVYHVTHYYTLIFSQGVQIFSLISDPFGWGWDLFGTAGKFASPWLPDMKWVWHTQVGLIVFGHLVSICIAHREAQAIFATARQVMLSQLPMLGLMMAFTASGLWILAQPISGAG